MTRPIDIQILKPAESARRRLGLYFGGSDNRGYFNAVVGALLCLAEMAVENDGLVISMQINADGTVVLEENRGVITFGGNSVPHGIETIPGNRYGYGLFAARAVSTFAQFQSYQRNQLCKLTFIDGTLKSQNFEEATDKAKVGSVITFSLDKNLFDQADGQLPYNRIAGVMRNLAACRPGLCLKLSAEAANRRSIFRFDEGMKSLLEENMAGRPEPNVLQLAHEDERGTVSLAFAQLISHKHRGHIYAFVNGEQTLKSGTHLTGLREGFTETLTREAVNAKLEDLNSKVNTDKLFSGLICALSIWTEHLSYANDSLRWELTSTIARDLVKEAIEVELPKLLRAHQGLLESLYRGPG